MYKLWTSAEINLQSHLVGCTVAKKNSKPRTCWQVNSLLCLIPLPGDYKINTKNVIMSWTYDGTSEWTRKWYSFSYLILNLKVIACQRNIMQTQIVDSWKTQPPSLPSELYKRQLYIEFLNKLTCLHLACSFSRTDSLPSPTCPTAHIYSEKFCLWWSCTSVLTCQALVWPSP